VLIAGSSGAGKSTMAARWRPCSACRTPSWTRRGTGRGGRCGRSVGRALTRRPYDNGNVERFGLWARAFHRLRAQAMITTR
jgi:hypothetical protein